MVPKLCRPGRFYCPETRDRDPKSHVVSAVLPVGFMEFQRQKAETNEFVLSSSQYPCWQLKAFEVATRPVENWCVTYRVKGEKRCLCV